MSASLIGDDGIGRPFSHDHRWTKEYAPGYRHESEADDFRWVCDACTETHGMSWEPPSATSVAVEETIRFMDRIHAIEGTKWPRTEERIDWPKKWSADEIAWVKRQIIGEYLRDTGRCDCVCARHP